MVGQDEKVFGKDKGVEKLDPFFVEATGSVDEDENDQHQAQSKAQVEKRAVMRDGRVPKFQKNIEKM